MALGMKETPTYPMQTHMLLQDVGKTTSTMNSSMSPVNYGKITISQETLAGFQYLPPSHIQKPSLPRGLTMSIPVSSQLRTQTMNLYYIVVFVICTINTMSMTVIIILLNGILMMGIHLVLPIKQFQNSSRMFQNSSRSPRTTFATQLLFQEYIVPTPTKLPTDHYSLHSTKYTVQNHYSEKQGDRILFINSDCYCSLNSTLTESLRLLFTFS